ncbi:hypothetical protein SAY86_029897 [Trapa natans]|uniref:Gnk2-homologous domain-containing protein n=1 Tax=Trapa natans TaxID=22666 RepID=A0AAN7MM29_TRANT|nr:hypothetical protein SAY86_029897 [Trapa natans]
MANDLRSLVFQPPEYHLLLIFLFVVFRPFLLEATDPLYRICGSTGNFTANSTYQENLSSLLSSVSSDDNITYGFYNISSGQSPDQVNGIALCRGDVALSD